MGRYLCSQSQYEITLVGWCDFNVILSDKEKIGGLPIYPQEYEDFTFCVNSCKLFDINFQGIPFTWWNGRANKDCIFKRLDRILINQAFLGLVVMLNWRILLELGLTMLHYF